MMEDFTLNDALSAVFGEPKQVAEGITLYGGPDTGQPGVAVYDMEELHAVDADPNDNVWALYIFDAQGFHSGRQWFAKTVTYADEQITIPEARARCAEAMAASREVRVCDGGDRLVFHYYGKQILHGGDFWTKAMGGADE
jgi:hypothetical protein